VQGHAGDAQIGASFAALSSQRPDAFAPYHVEHGQMGPDASAAAIALRTHGWQAETATLG